MSVPNTEEFSSEDCATRLKLLSEPNRLRIINRLMASPLTVTEICRELNLEQSLVSHHMQKLRKFGLVDSKRSGKNIIYTMTQPYQGDQKQISIGCCTINFPSGNLPATTV